MQGRRCATTEPPSRLIKTGGPYDFCEILSSDMPFGLPKKCATLLMIGVRYPSSPHWSKDCDSHTNPIMNIFS